MDTSPLLHYSVTNEVTFLSNDLAERYFLFTSNGSYFLFTGNGSYFLFTGNGSYFLFTSNGSYFLGPLLSYFLLCYSVILLVL